jgi:hypothetical protein
MPNFHRRILRGGTLTTSRLGRHVSLRPLSTLFSEIAPSEPIRFLVGLGDSALVPRTVFFLCGWHASSSLRSFRLICTDLLSIGWIHRYQGLAEDDGTCSHLDWTECRADRDQCRNRRTGV